MPIVFAESDNFAAGLARWIAPPPKAAAPADGADAAPPAPTALEKECQALEEKGDVKALASKLREGVAKRLADAPAAEVQNAYAVLFELLVHWQLLAPEAEGLADELAARPSEQSELRCTLLLALYAKVQQHGALELRFVLLLGLIKFCTAAGQLGKILGAMDERVERVERWVGEWELSDAQQKELWGLVFDAHADDSRILYECALKYLALHDKGDLQAHAPLRERIMKGVLTTLRSPDLFRCDELSQLSVVQQLEADAKLAPLHRLLHIMARETYAEYLAFTAEATAAAFMKDHQLPFEACATKMRLLTLVSLGHANKELTYASIATALQVAPEEVETWVMQAIGSGLLTAKMDQVRQVVVVSMCAERDFGQHQWQRLHGNLVEWRDSIRSLLQVLQTARPAS